MSVTSLSQRSGSSSRGEHILDAAEACFVRNGFHRTTMQDIAREATMSPGNIYRYFESKEAVVLGMAAREGERGRALVEHLQAIGDLRAALVAILDEYFVATTRAAAVLRLDLWSEATRNPVMAAMIRGQETALRGWFTKTLSALAGQHGADIDGLYDILAGLMRSVLIDRALLDDYDAAPAVAQLHALLDAGLAGRLPVPARDSLAERS